LNEEDCKPFLMLHDIGLTFRARELSQPQQHRGRELRLWRDTPLAQRRVHRTPREVQHGDTRRSRISEAGRAFLAGLIDQLSDQRSTICLKSARRTPEPQAGSDKRLPASTSGCASGRARRDRRHALSQLRSRHTMKAFSQLPPQLPGLLHALVILPVAAGLG
jgi:hypothetical protein